MTIKGKAAHAGVAPEKGISATLVAAVALAEAHKAGWFGKVSKHEGRGTSNVGIFGGEQGKPAGDATNVVTDYAYIKGEARSPKAAFATQIATRLQGGLHQGQGRDQGREWRHRRGEIQPRTGLSPVQPGQEKRGRRLRQQGGRIPRAQADISCSRTAGSMPIGSTSTAFPRSPSVPANTRSTP